MKGILCATKAMTNEEYRQELVKKRIYYVLIIMVGVITLAITYFASANGIEFNEHLHGTFAGMGTGLILAGVVLIIKTQMTLSSEEKLKAARLNNSDERNMEISSRAFRSAALIMIISFYVTALIGSIMIDERLIQLLLVNMSVLLAGYILSYNYYKRKL